MSDARVTYGPISFTDADTHVRVRHENEAAMHYLTADEALDLLRWLETWRENLRRDDAGNIISRFQ